jgi:hypothetical protein
MSVHSPAESSLRYALGSLLAFGAVNAFAGGYYGLSGARDVPTAWLDGSPFTSYFVPSLILLVVVGGSFLIAAVAVFSDRPSAGRTALGSGVIVLVWVAAQVAIIGFVSWLQPATAAAGLLIVFLAWLLRPPR